MKITLSLVLTILSFAAFANSSNGDLIKSEVLGQTFCYTDNSSSGWIFGENGQAVRHAVNLGMPGPGSYYQVTFIESPRTYGNFTLVNSNQTLHFIVMNNKDLFEYQSGKTLSVKACRR